VLDLEKYGVRRNRERIIQAAAISLYPASNFFRHLIIVRALVGVAHIDLIEHIFDCLPIVRLGVQTA
jgi:hypothetical protein